MVEDTTLALVTTDDKVLPPTTVTTVVVYGCVTWATSADVIVVTLLTVARLMVDAPVPLPITTISDEAVVDDEPLEVRDDDPEDLDELVFPAAGGTLLPACEDATELAEVEATDSLLSALVALVVV